jgi:hypothetical protein
MTDFLSVGRRERRMLIVGTLACGAIAATGRGIPLWRAWSAMRLSEAADAERQLKVASDAVQNAQVIEEEARHTSTLAQADDSTLIHGVTPAAAGAALVVLLGVRADSNHFGITSASVRADTGFAHGFARARVRLSATADVRGLTRFLASVEARAPLIAVRELTISQSDPAAANDHPEMLRIELTLEALVRPATNARTAAAAAQELTPAMLPPRAAAETTIANDPFRLSNSPPDINAASGGPKVVAPPRAARPLLVLKAITGGPPWQAIVAGIPGQSGDAIVASGAALGALTVQTITRDTVIIRSSDTTWILSLKRSN